MLGIDPSQQLTLVVSEGNRVIGLARARLPRGFLTRQHNCQAIEVSDDRAIDRLVEREQSCLVRQELADRDSLFSLLRELRPVRAHPFLVVEPTPRMGDGKRHRGQALGGRVHNHHRVLSPKAHLSACFEPRPTGRRRSRCEDMHSRRRPVRNDARSCPQTRCARTRTRDRRVLVLGAIWRRTWVLLSRHPTASRNRHTSGDRVSSVGGYSLQRANAVPSPRGHSDVLGITEPHPQPTNAKELHRPVNWATAGAMRRLGASPAEYFTAPCKNSRRASAGLGAIVLPSVGISAPSRWHGVCGDRCEATCEKCAFACADSNRR